MRPLRKTGPLAPKRRRGLSVAIGVEEDDFVTRDADGRIRREPADSDDSPSR